MRPQDFYVRAKANEGIRVALESGDWLQVRSIWSDDYGRQATQMKRQALAEVALLASAGGSAEARRIYKWQCRARRAGLVASLIADWSFPVKCTETSKTLLLIRSPRLRRQIELIAENMHTGGEHG